MSGTNLSQFCKAIWRVLAGLLFILVVGKSWAATVAVVLSDDTAPYQEATDAIEARLGKEHTVVRILAQQANQSEAALSSAKMIVPVGVRAARTVAERGGRTPVLSVLVPREWYLSEGKTALSEGGRQTSAIFIDQPSSRQFHLILSALPSVTKVGVVLSRQGANQLPELDRQAKSHRLALVSATLEPGARLVETLERVLGEVDLLLLPFPDSEVLNRTTAQSLFMTSYRFRDPVVGYSQSLVKAGALLSVYTNPAQAGRHAAELAERLLSGEKLPQANWPKYFAVSVNEHVARSLDIRVPSETVLLKRLQDADEHN